MRATFHSRYAVGKHQRGGNPNHNGPRLGDYMTCVMALDSVDALAEPAKAEFCVVDTQQREKAFVEMPFGATPASVKTLIESHFDARATRVTDKIWIV